MTIGPDSFGSNGASKNDDRFATPLGQYRPGARRESGRGLAGDVSNGDHAARNGAGVLESRGGVGVGDVVTPGTASIPAPTTPERSLRDSAPGEPSRRRERRTGEPESLAEHPLLRGLLMELPPKGEVPPPEYLDRWFEAARSILDLLYTMSARP